jgi:hypothetical protein
MRKKKEEERGRRNNEEQRGRRTKEGKIAICASKPLLGVGEDRVRALTRTP